MTFKTKVIRHLRKSNLTNWNHGRTYSKYYVSSVYRHQIYALCDANDFSLEDISKLTEQFSKNRENQNHNQKWYAKITNKYETFETNLKGI